MNPFGGQIPPGWKYKQVSFRSTHGVAIYMVTNEKGEVISMAQFDQNISARTHLTYLWDRYHQALGLVKNDGRNT